jgi:putative membrane protein
VLTTSSRPSPVSFRSNRLLHVLIGLFVVVWLVSAINPAIPEDWFLENLLVFFLIGLLAATYRVMPFSGLSYVLIFVFLCLHECGAHYQYSDAVPGEWIKPLLGASRNHFDRVMHFLFGLFLAYPQREVLMRKAGLSSGWAGTIAIFTTLALSAAYEIIEAIVASIVDPANAQAFLGAQGDIWDSQEDMAMCLAGACVSILMIHVLGRIMRISRG